MNCFEASIIEMVFAKKCENIHPDNWYVNCPYCHELNILPDSNRGYRICGSCKQIFDVR